MARRLFVVQDDLIFAQRVRGAAGRLGVPVEAIGAATARSRAWKEDDVVVLQATLRPEQQLALVDELVHRQPSPLVIAVTGHLETALRHRLKALGATLAAHSSMDRVLARALGISARGADAAPHPSA
ncbi:MAG: response regulator [Chloroflexi bacterium]|nr:MAG: response regulator [Chloroflexota bacterium]